jgi:hypothetical protein
MVFPGDRGTRARGAISIAVAVSALMLVAWIPPSDAGAALPGPRSTGYLPMSASGADFRPASMGFSGRAGAVAAAADPIYDEQIGTTFTQNFTTLTYNVTALAQADADGYGPAYILNGLSSAGYWYQVGISYHWPSSGGSYNPNFGFSYQVYGPSGRSVFPTNGGAGLGGFSKVVRSGDSVLLSLTFSGTTVQMLAQDWNTGATAKTSFNSFGSSTFVGQTSRPANSQGFFTGLMTEWYHALPYSGNEGKVTYTNRAVALSSAWMWIDEFASGSSGSPVFINQTKSPVTFANEQQVYPFASNGATVYGSAHEFITGLLSAAFSRVALTPSVAEAASPGFNASYTLAGLRQSTDVAPGAGAVVEADPGTTVMVSVNSSSSSALEKWVFSGGTGGSSVTFKAGTNVTFVYYHLVHELVSYQVASGGKPLPASSSPVLVFQAPPATPSAAPGQVPAAQRLGASPVEIFALQGSAASVNGTISGAAGERWAASGQNWTIAAPDAIPAPILFFDQYMVSIGYSITGGGAPPSPPELASTSLGVPSSVKISGNVTTAWFDVGSTYSFKGVLNGSTPAERWVGIITPAPPVVSAPNQVLSEAYNHQYYADLGVNDARGGSVSQASEWVQAGSSLHASAVANPRWQFEAWNGSGAGAYTGTSTTIDVAVNAPLSEKATFYVQLSIAADSGTSVAYSYGPEAGTVQAGTTKTVFVPPSASVTLSANPSVFYSFASWQGAAPSAATKPSLTLVVDSPGAVAGTSSLNYPLIYGGAGAALMVVLAASLLIRRRRRRGRFGSFNPSNALALSG